MNGERGYFILLLVSLVSLLGCSHGVSPVDPAVVEPVETAQALTHNLLGYYTFECDPSLNKVEIIPLRDAELHLNALKFLEPPMLVYLTLESPPQFSGGILNVDIGLRNPYLGLHQFTGFDVCGIVFTHGSVSGFSDPDIVMAGEGDTRLLNADGYTRWWNPSEFPHGDTIFNYVDGMLGTPADAADFNCTINGYKYFADGLGPNDPLTSLDITKRGMFSAGAKNVRHYKIEVSGGLIFNYAIDACWKQPLGAPPYEPPDDFRPGANRAEAWDVRVTESGNTLYYEESTGVSSGELHLQIDVWDHYNAASNTVHAESLSGLPLCSALTATGGGEGYSTYELDFTGDALTHGGEAELLITVESETSGYGGLLPGEPVCAYFIHTFNIGTGSGPSGGWARTWGGSEYDWAHGVTTDEDGNIYVGGCFYNTVDFDPGPGVETRTAQGFDDISICKYSPAGEFQWVCAWGGTFYDWDRGIAYDNGYIYIVGGFRLAVDFDPGPGTDIHTSNGEGDAYLAKFDTDGNFIWARTWGGSEFDECNAAVVDGSGNISVTGNFRNSVDFDPGPGSDVHLTKGADDIFVSKFNPDGELLFAHTIGGAFADTGQGLAVDSSDNIYFTGGFCMTADFDPGSGIDEHTSAGGQDAFMCKLDASGGYFWVVTWGCTTNDAGMGIDHEAGNIFVTGYFEDTVDFDPGGGVEEYVSNGMRDIFVSKFVTGGDFTWVKTWGGIEIDQGAYVNVDNTGNVFVTGLFFDTVDFDPGTGVDEHSSAGLEDAFISKLNPSGELIWVHTWGDIDVDWGIEVAVDDYGVSYAVGCFSLTVEFEPGPGVEEHISNGVNDVYLVKLLQDGYW